MSHNLISQYTAKYNQYSENNDYDQVAVRIKEWKLIHDSTEILKYLPQENNVHLEIGISQKKKETLQNFQSVSLNDTIRNKRGHVINTGGSIWALAFVPKKTDDTTMQYLSVGGYNSTIERHVLGAGCQGPNSIHVYKCSSSIEADDQRDQKPVLDMCILHDFGPVCDFIWCPYSVFNEKEGKLGILSVMFVDGSIRVFVVPHPQFIRNEENTTKQDETIYIRAESPRLSLQLPNIFNLCMGWGGHRKLACGTRSGHIVIWDILESLLKDKPVVNTIIPGSSPIAIRSITWQSLFNEFILISCDLTGTINLHDLRDPYIASKILRLRGTNIRVVGIGHHPGFLCSDIDGTTKYNSHYYLKKKTIVTSHNSVVWSLAASPFHGVLTSVGSNGTALARIYVDDTNHVSRHKPLEHTLYRLEYHSDTQTFHYIDGIKPTQDSPDREFHNALLDPILSLHNITWNNNKNAAGWVASGGEAGLCRIEFIGY